jgi:hypothetical protein
MSNIHTTDRAEGDSCSTDEQTRRLTRFVWLGFALGVLFGASATVLVLWLGAHQAAASPAPATLHSTASVTMLGTVESGTGGVRPESMAAMLAADPGVALYSYMHAHGATMPPSWAQVVDNRHTSACTEFARNYADYPAGYVDEFGVSKVLARAAVIATGFCAGA